jgi:methyl-accepting chemotaxis protein
VDLGALSGRLFPRLLVTVLLAFVPFAIVMAVLLTNRGAAGIESAVDDSVRAGATSLASRTDDFLTNRQRELSYNAAALARLPWGDTRRQTDLLERLRGSFDSAVLLDTDARQLAVAPAGRRFPAEGTEWFAAAAAGRPAIGAPVRSGQGISMILAYPVMDRDRVRGVVAADLDLTPMYGFVADSKLGSSGSSQLIDAASQVLVQTGAARPASETDLLHGGSLRASVDTDPARQVLQGRAGVDEHEEIGGDEFVAGYAPIPKVGWGAIVRQERDEAFSAVGDQRSLALLVIVLGTLVAAGLAYLFAQQATRPIRSIGAAARAVADGDLTTRVTPDGAVEFQELGSSFNTMVDALDALVARIDDTGAELSRSATELAGAAEQLAATTQEQSTAATETSATMEELARTFTGIADTVSGVATQTAGTREVLDETDRDLQASSERALALAERVGEVSALLELINEIADQTNRLAFDAAIEAARAGDAGRGFTVVADEVRQLAERSKDQAEEIGRIIGETQSETDATVMAMEASSKQMKHGLELMDHVAEATERVRLTTQQQSAAAAQAVDTMEAVTETSRQTSTTAQQISTAANQLTALVEQLREATAGVEARR